MRRRWVAGGEVRAAAGAAALAVVCLWSGSAVAAALEFSDSDGTVLFACELRSHDRWCLRWNHSVAGFAVQDCFVFRPPNMVLDESLQRDFAAGLGQVQGRGEVRTDVSGGYRIVGIDMPVAGNRLVLRVGSSAVNHRVIIGDTALLLSERAPGRRIVMRIADEGPGVAERPRQPCTGGE